MPRYPLLACTMLCSMALHAQPERPNIVFIMTDDVGYGDLGIYGAPDLRTPVLDQLAHDGVRFTDFYSNGATCSPTRAGLMSGRYQQRYGIEAPLPNVSRADGHGLVPEGHSLPQLLKNSGYRTGLVGKWHLGYTPEQSPEAHGFDYFFGFKSGYIDYYQHTDGAGDPDLFENNAPIQAEGYFTDLITQRSVQFIEQHQDEPFFLSIQYSAAHWPYQRPNDPSVAVRNAAHLQPNEQDTGTRDDYVAMLEHADNGIGQVLAALDAAGLREDTLVIYTNDNGGEWLSNNAPFFNRKFSVWEGGIRVPAIMRWPGVIPPGQVTDQVGITMDFTATFLKLAKATLPEGYVPEGIDLLPIVSGQAPELERTLFWSANNTYAVRSGDYKLVQQGPQSFFVYKVSEDLGERNDLTRQSQGIAQRLYALLDAWRADVTAERDARHGD